MTDPERPQGPGDKTSSSPGQKAGPGAGRKAGSSPGLPAAIAPPPGPHPPPHPAPLLSAPNGEPLPLAYRWLRANGVSRLLPWTFIDDPEDAQRLRGEFVREVAPPNATPVRDLVPFARRRDRDEIAGFVVDGGRLTSEVALVALTGRGRPEKKGWPALQRFADFWAFAREALLEDASELANEESLARLLSGKPR